MNQSLLLAQSLIARKVILKLCWFGTRCNISSVTLQPKNEAAEKVRLVASRNCKTISKLICYFFMFLLMMTIYISKCCVSLNPQAQERYKWGKLKYWYFWFCLPVYIYCLHTCDMYMYQLYAKCTFFLPHSRCPGGTSTFRENETLYSIWIFRSRVWHVTFWYLCSVNKPLNVKVWTAKWDNYLTINP